MVRFWQTYILKNISVSLRDKKGVTLVELLVALALTSILVIFVFSLHLFGNKLVIEWTKKAELEDIALLCMESLKKDISDTRELLVAELYRIELMRNDDEKIAYEIKDGKLLRNGESLTKDKISAENLNFNYYHKRELGQTGYLPVKDGKDIDRNMNLRLDEKELELITDVKIELTLKGYGKRMELENFIRLKNSISVY